MALLSIMPPLTARNIPCPDCARSAAASVAIGSLPGRGVLALAPPASGVALWLCTLDSIAADIERLESTISADELARAGRFGTPLLCRRWIAGRATLRVLLGQTLGLEPGSVRLRRGTRGRPELD